MNTRSKANYIYELIAQGEHQQQDFKFEISDARKIARSLSAFANTDGGRLLIGVKDNGKIAGIRSEEEAYMIGTAANLYCSPKIEYTLQAHHIEGRTVLEVIISAGKQKPYRVKEEDKKNYAYIRVKDENILATPVHLKVWQMERSAQGAFIQFSKEEQILLDYLNRNEQISFRQFYKMAAMNLYETEDALAKLIHIGLLESFYTGKTFNYRLKPENT